MRVKILYSVDDTVTEMVLTGHRVGVQIYKDGRGIARVYSKKGKARRSVLFAKVHLIDRVVTK